MIISLGCRQCLQKSYAFLHRFRLRIIYLRPYPPFIDVVYWVYPTCLGSEYIYSVSVLHARLPFFDILIENVMHDHPFFFSVVVVPAKDSTLFQVPWEASKTPQQKIESYFQCIFLLLLNINAEFSLYNSGSELSDFLTSDAHLCEGKNNARLSKTDNSSVHFIEIFFRLIVRVIHVMK